MRRLPLGRVGTTRFLSITGLSKQTYYRRYRYAPEWIERFDVRVTEDGILSFDQAAAEEFAAERLGEPATDRSPRANRLRHDPEQRS